VHGEAAVLTLVPQANTDRLAEARELLRLVEFGRPALWVLCELLLLPLLGVGLLLVGLYLGYAVIGGAVALGLSRYGPCWWPGKR
jgi:hypothetical protein